MATRRRKLKLALALMLDEDELWRSELKKKKKRTHRFWVRPWIGDEEKKESSTMFALQKELEVTPLVPTSIERVLKPFLVIIFSQKYVKINQKVQIIGMMDVMVEGCHI